jgi:hypothetical protein
MVSPPGYRLYPRLPIPTLTPVGELPTYRDGFAFLFPRRALLYTRLRTVLRFGAGRPYDGSISASSRRCRASLMATWPWGS